MTVPMIFNYMGILLDKQALEGEDVKINITLPDVQEKYLLHIKSGVLLYYENGYAEDADLSVTCPKNALLLVLNGDFESLIQAIKAEGDTEILKTIMKNLNQFTLNAEKSFNLIEP